MADSEKGYVIALCDNGDSYIVGALHIERDDNLVPWKYEDDAQAAKAAEQDGIKLIYGMEGVEDGIYLDTPDNRRTLKAALREHIHKPSIRETMQKFNEQIACSPHTKTCESKKSFER